MLRNGTCPSKAANMVTPSLGEHRPGNLFNVVGYALHPRGPPVAKNCKKGGSRNRWGDNTVPGPIGSRIGELPRDRTVPHEDSRDDDGVHPISAAVCSADCSQPSAKRGLCVHPRKQQLGAHGHIRTCVSRISCHAPPTRPWARDPATTQQELLPPLAVIAHRNTSAPLASATALRLVQHAVPDA